MLFDKIIFIISRFTLINIIILEYYFRVFIAWYYPAFILILVQPVVIGEQTIISNSTNVNHPGVIISIEEKQFGGESKSLLARVYDSDLHFLFGNSQLIPIRPVYMDFYQWGVTVKTTLQLDVILALVNDCQLYFRLYPKGYYGHDDFVFVEYQTRHDALPFQKQFKDGLFLTHNKDIHTTFLIYRVCRAEV